jgi:TolB-like protein
MSSIVPGYAYDIFISYRHKDNKYDGWVTTFVENLRKELDATFKDPVSVYFDENVTDGVRETHLVEDSVSPKLKCLVFIPVISQTYCDPESYAFRNELLLFNKLAAGDAIGSKVTLHNGNVVSRILPIRVHEVEEQDKLLFERATGNQLRPIDFIFKYKGVNRPLRSNEDHPADNEARTYYRDQINKVALHLKDVVNAVKSPGRKPEKTAAVTADNTPTRRKHWKWITATTAFLFISAIALYYVTSKKTRDNERVTIAVLPFKVIGDDVENQYFADGVMEVLRSNLNMIPAFRVKPRISVDRYRDNTKTIPEMADELGVSYILEGSAQKIGDRIRIIVQLVDTETEENVWSEKFDGSFEDIFEVQNTISESIVHSLQMSLTPALAKTFNKVPTQNFEAYDLFLQAKSYARKYAQLQAGDDRRKAITLLHEALRLDPGFALAFAWLAGLESISDPHTPGQSRDSVIFLANHALAIDSTLVEAQLVLSDMYNRESNDVHTLRYTYAALMNPDLDSASVETLLMRVASVYARIGESERAEIIYDEIQRRNPKSAGALHQKFYAIAPTHDIVRLEALASALAAADENDTFLALIKAHVLMEKRNPGAIASACAALGSGFKANSDVIEQYALIYAWSLRLNNRAGDSEALVQSFEQKFGDDNYFKSQLALLRDDTTRALGLISSEQIGWHTINLCQINPIFERVRNNPRFIEFLKRNTDAIASRRERIRQLEVQGYLGIPQMLLPESEGTFVSL